MKSINNQSRVYIVFWCHRRTNVIGKKSKFLRQDNNEADDNALSFSTTKAELRSLHNNKIFDQTKFKAFADDNFNVAQLLIFVFHRTENIVRKGENTGYQHFLLFPQCFQKASFSGSFKPGIVWKRVKIFEKILDKMLVTGIFFLFLQYFRKLLLQGRQNQGLFEQGLKSHEKILM